MDNDQRDTENDTRESHPNLLKSRVEVRRTKPAGEADANQELVRENSAFGQRRRDDFAVSRAVFEQLSGMMFVQPSVCVTRPVLSVARPELSASDARTRSRKTNGPPSFATTGKREAQQ